MLESLNSLYCISKSCENISIRVISFSNVAKYFIGNENESLKAENAYGMWQNLTPRGATDTAHAVRLCKKAIESDYKNGNADKTVAILVTDGKSSDHNDFVSAIGEIKDSVNSMKGKLFIFASIGVRDYDEEELYQFAKLGDCNSESYNASGLVYKIDEMDDLTEIFAQIISVN
jgi:uncharacterized protein YegL